MTWIESLWVQALEIWTTGGWAMIALAINAIVMFAIGLSVSFRLGATGFRRVRESTWRQWIDDPGKRDGRIGRLLDTVAGLPSIPDTARRFADVRRTELDPFNRDLKVMQICVTAAPLLGLLGTVTGMLTTFAALASGSGGDQTMGMVAAGISEALVTTETGLMIALPGLFFRYVLVRKHEAYRAFLSHLESVIMQGFHLRPGPKTA